MIPQNFNLDASNWYLSGIQTDSVMSIFDYVIDKYEDIKDKELQAMLKERINNYLYYLNNSGKEFLLEPLRNLQPKSFDVLDRFASNYKIGFLWNSIIPVPNLPKNNFVSKTFFEVNGRLIFIDVAIWPDKDFGGEKYLETIPDVLANSWLRHGAGWGIGTLPLPSQSYRQLIGNQYNWYSVEEALNSYDRNWTKTNMMDILQEKVRDVYVTHYNPHDGRPSEWCSMRCFLDTRPYDLVGKCGDQFFVVDSRTDKVVYHIHDGDVENLRILESSEVGEAMDAYCAHTLLRTQTRFDFLPWSKLL